MLERLLFSVLLILLGASALATFRYLHLQRASRVSSPVRVKAGRPTLLYFRSDSCAPCVTQAQYLRGLELEFNGKLAVQKIDADVDRETADRYGVFTLPTTLVLDRRGEVKHINYGLTATAKLARQLESVV